MFQKEGNIARHIFKSPASKQSAPLFGSLLETVQSTIGSANQFNKDFARNDVFNHVVTHNMAGGYTYVSQVNNCCN